MLTRWGPVLILLLIAVGSGWMLKELSDEEIVKPDASRHTPDFYMDDFSTTTMDESGNPKRRLMAEHMEHFPDTDTNEFEKPYLIIYHPTRPPWHVKSERGWVSGGNEVMLLLGKVHIWQDNEAGIRELDIKTRDLRVLPESQYGETDKPVVIRTQTTESRSVGMRAYLEQRRVELLSRVRTVYEKKSP